MLKNNLQIAIDGPVAAGKGTIAAQIAKELKIAYVDTGSMYRTVALLGIKNNIDLTDEKKIVDLLDKSTIELKVVKHDHGTFEIFLNGENVSSKIRTQKVSQGSSIVATLPKVRSFLVKKQQEIARAQSVVMEGRDITTKVLPNADLKIYLTASQKERARRRKKQLEEKGINIAFNKILDETKERDERDTKREADPLVVAPDAYVLDTTNLSIEEVVDKVLKRLK
jgi:cytidylate kinase